MNEQRGRRGRGQGGRGRGRRQGGRGRGRGLPNWQRLAEVSTGIVQNIQGVAEDVPAFVHEIQCIENAPKVDLEGRIRLLEENVAKQNEDLIQQRETSQKITQQLLQLQESVQKLTPQLMQHMDQTAGRALIRAINSTIRAHDKVQPILVNEKTPPNFPLTLADLLRLGEDGLIELLEFYQIPAIGTMHERRSQLLRFFGVYLP